MHELAHELRSLHSFQVEFAQLHKSRSAWKVVGNGRSGLRNKDLTCWSCASYASASIDGSAAVFAVDDACVAGEDSLPDSHRKRPIPLSDSSLAYKLTHQHR